MTSKEWFNSLTVDAVCNVRNPSYFGYDREPLMRKVTRTEWKIKPDGRWFYWYWEPQRSSGQYDCGFSGIREDALNNLLADTTNA
jgi:hypothetical protein